MCGVNSLAFYQTTIFHEYLGVSAPDARIISAGVFTWQTLCAPVGVVTVARYGRRRLLMFAALGTGVCTSIVAGTAPLPDSRPTIIVAGIFRLDQSNHVIVTSALSEIMWSSRKGHVICQEPRLSNFRCSCLRLFPPTMERCPRCRNVTMASRL